MLSKNRPLSSTARLVVKHVKAYYILVLYTSNYYIFSNTYLSIYCFIYNVHGPDGLFHLAVRQHADVMYILLV